MKEQAKEYRRLETKFKYLDWFYWLIARQGDVALLANTRPGSRFWLYEVVIIQKHNEWVNPRGLLEPAREKMPPSTAWGSKAWSPHGWDRALQLFEEKCQKYADGLTRVSHPQLTEFKAKADGLDLESLKTIS